MRLAQIRPYGKVHVAGFSAWGVGQWRTDCDRSITYNDVLRAEESLVVYQDADPFCSRCRRWYRLERRRQSIDFQLVARKAYGRLIPNGVMP